LILMDIWAGQPNDEHRERMEANIRSRLLPLVSAAREHGILIVHSPHGRAIHDMVRPLPGEVIVDGPDERAQLNTVLAQRGIEYLLHAGYASNTCILNRPTGIISLARDGYRDRIILVRDASLAVEAPEFAERKLSHKVIVFTVELNRGATTTVDDVLAGLAAR
jgi:nicotinamidase-related amidase